MVETVNEPPSLKCCWHVTPEPKCDEFALVMRRVGRYDVMPLCAAHDQALTKACRDAVTLAETAQS